jgi:hypothetical protein
MSNSNFVKSECGHCGGHLEFPADAIGQTIPCPHCGKRTELLAPELPDKTGDSGLIWLAIVIILCLAAGVPGMIWLKYRSNPPANSLPLPLLLPAVPSNGPPASATLKSRALVMTNDFAIMPFKLEKTPGSSLVYVTGTIQNASERQRFGIKVEFSLFDTNDTAIGTATDYQTLLEAHAEWRFKALVIESKAVSAKFGSIIEAQ